MFPQGEQGYTGDFHDFKSDSWQITDSVTFSSKTSNKNLIIVVKERQTTIFRHESSDLLVVFLQLYSDTLSDSRVRLFSLNGNLLDDDSSSMGRPSEGIGFPLGSTVSFVVILIGPTDV